MRILVTGAKGFVGKFASMASAMGYTEKQAYNMSTALTGLAGDVASYYHISADEAYAKLGAVFTGETEALKQLGVVMTQKYSTKRALLYFRWKRLTGILGIRMVISNFSFQQHGDSSLPFMLSLCRIAPSTRMWKANRLSTLSVCEPSRCSKIQECSCFSSSLSC